MEAGKHTEANATVVGGQGTPNVEMKRKKKKTS